MNKPKKVKPARRTAVRKSGKKNQATRTLASESKLRRPSPLEVEWDEFKIDTLSKVRQRVNSPVGEKFAPYDRADSILKRMVYKFVRQHRQSKGFKHIETAISNDRDSGRTMRIRFDDNPFHWVLFGLKNCVGILGKFEIDKFSVSRFAKQLSYADRHDIEPELLIGFLLQTGTMSEVCEKADNSNSYEGWFLAKKHADDGGI